MNGSACTVCAAATAASQRHVVALEREVAGDRAGEQEHVLQHDADVAAQRREIPVAHVDAVDQDAAALHVVDAVEQLDHRRLARRRWRRRWRSSRPARRRTRRRAAPSPRRDRRTRRARTRCGRAPRRARAAASGLAIGTGWSSSSKMRSADAIADCMTAYLVREVADRDEEVLHVLDERDQRAEGERAGDDLRRRRTRR